MQSPDFCKTEKHARQTLPLQEKKKMISGYERHPKNIMRPILSEAIGDSLAHHPSPPCPAAKDPTTQTFNNQRDRYMFFTLSHFSFMVLLMLFRVK